MCPFDQTSCSFLLQGVAYAPVSKSEDFTVRVPTGVQASQSWHTNRLCLQQAQGSSVSTE